MKGHTWEISPDLEKAQINSALTHEPQPSHTAHTAVRRAGQPFAHEGGNRPPSQPFRQLAPGISHLRRAGRPPLFWPDFEVAS